MPGSEDSDKSVEGEEDNVDQEAGGGGSSTLEMRAEDYMIHVYVEKLKEVNVGA